MVTNELIITTTSTSVDAFGIVRALDNPVRISMIKILLPSREGMTVKDMLAVLKDTNQIRYRETVYRNLEVLKDAGLVEKFYVEDRGICYRIRRKKVQIDLTKLEEEVA